MATRPPRRRVIATASSCQPTSPVPDGVVRAPRERRRDGRLPARRRRVRRRSGRRGSRPPQLHPTAATAHRCRLGRTPRGRRRTRHPAGPLVAPSTAVARPSAWRSKTLRVVTHGATGPDPVVVLVPVMGPIGQIELEGIRLVGLELGNSEPSTIDVVGGDEAEDLALTFRRPGKRHHRQHRCRGALAIRIPRNRSVVPTQTAAERQPRRRPRG